MKNDKKKQIPLEKVKTIILSVIVSIMLWVAIINVVNPDVTETVYNIPIATTGLAELREKYIIDRNTLIHSGYRDGIAEGEKRGIEEGSKNEKIAIAKKMKNAKANIDFIAQMTGLTKEEIEKL